MKKRLLLLLALCLMAMGAYPRYLGDMNNDGEVSVTDVMTIVNIIIGKTTDYDFVYADINQDGSVDVTDVMMAVGIILGKVQATHYIEDNTVYVTFSGNNVEVVKPNRYNFISYTVSGGHVAIVNSDATQEITFSLSGSTTDGSFTYNGSYKATFVLNGVDITNPSGAAIDIECGKRIALELAEGTTNTLTDGAGGQKAALYCKGHLEVSKGGVLTVCGNTRHAIMSKEYMLLKKTVGSITITGAANDGIHAGQYFQMNGGTLTIGNVAGDAIQAEATSDSSDEDNGQLNVKGGEMDLTVTSADCDALKSDSLLTISGGTIHITTTGDADKGIKSKLSAVNISGGDITITQSGGKIIGADDISYSTGIKSETGINISGGSITVNNQADGGKGFSTEGDINISESDASVTIDITANGAGGSAELTGGESSTTTSSYVVYVALPATSGGMGGMGGGSSNYWTSLYLYNSNGEKVATLTNTVTKTSGSTTKTFYYYNFQSSDSGTYYFASDDYTSKRPGGGSYSIRSTTFTGPTTGEDYYYEISNSRTTSGSTYTFTLSNVTNTWNGSSSDLSEDEGTSYNASGMKADGSITIDGGTVKVKNSGAMSKSIKSKAAVILNGGDVTLTPSGAMQVISNDASYSTGVKCIDFLQNGGVLTINASGAAGRGISATNIITNGGVMAVTNSGGGQQGTNDSYTAKCLKADTKIELRAGDITLTATGNGGKGIKSSGTYTQGTADGEGPKLTVVTTGSSFGSSSGGGGGWGPQQNSGSSAKAIKIQGTAYVYGGETNINTSTNGAEGFESKTAVYIEGGKHYLKCYDDCINSSGNIYFNGGITVCYSNGNDAVDSNAGRAGAITIGNGIVFAYTSKGDPEEGLDCDNNSNIQITGTGIAISAGGKQGGGGGWGGSSGSTISNAKQGYYFCTSSISYASNKYYTLTDESGNNLVTYRFSANVSSSLGLFTATGMKSGSKYYVKSSDTAPTDATISFQGIYIGSTLVGNNSVTNFTAQ